MKHIKAYFLLFIFIIITICCNSSVSAAEEFKAIEKSEEFEKWENLSEEERKSSIQPLYQNITFKDSIKRSTYNNLFNLKENTGNGYYSLKEELNNIKVKDQDRTEACWAFSFSSVLETTYAKKSIYREYSPMHLELKSAKMFNRRINDGGSALISVAYATSGNGPVLENDMQVESVYNKQSRSYISNIENVDLNKTVTGRVTETKIFPSILKTYNGSEVTYTDGLEEPNIYTTDQVKAIRDLIKKAIKEKGAITAQMYSDISVNQSGNYISNYFNTETAAYYCNDTSKTINHAVTIVGWDDGYQSTNFKEGNQPASNGAYIVLNSYGEGFGKDRIYVYIIRRLRNRNIFSRN